MFEQSANRVRGSGCSGREAVGRARYRQSAGSHHAKGEGYLHGNGYVVTWAIGHLASLAQPHEIRPEWKFWRRETLPMLPDAWPLVVYEKTKDQFEVVRKILSSPRVGRVICATDAGPRRRTDFPLHLRSGGVFEADQPAVDFVAHAGGHPQGIRRRQAGRAITSRWPMPRAGAAGPTGWWA